MQRLRIIHCLRTPVGGLFRHVCDLAATQARFGHRVGIVCDSESGGKTAAARLSTLAEACTLGIRRVPMSRHLGPRDFGAMSEIRTFAGEARPHILHGHGAKGGAYARLLARKVDARAIYTPHGGSLHFSRRSPAGLMYLTAERWLARRTDGLLFESAYAAQTYTDKVGAPDCPVRVVHNGLNAEDFLPVAPDDYAAEFLFIGELRHLKGVDVLIEALRKVQATRTARLVIVGEGPDAASLRALVEETSLANVVSFAGPMPARVAFRLAHTLVVPSRAESLPYIVLEAIAAGKPVIATRVGGIPEIYRELDHLLVPPDDPDTLATAMAHMLTRPGDHKKAATRLKRRARRAFTVEAMVNSIDKLYLASGIRIPGAQQARRKAARMRA